MSYLPAIEELKSEIAEARKALGEKEFVLAKLISWQEGKTAPLTGVIDRQLPALKLPPPASGGVTLIGELRRVIRQLSTQEFQVTQLEQLLKGNNYAVSGKYPRARISSELAKLVRTGEIVRTVEGAGAAPHKYRNSRMEVEKG